MPTESPADYDAGVENPSALWENDCNANKHECSGYFYYGGAHECAQGHTFWRTFDRRYMHPGADKVRIQGRIWTIDSWDGETFTVDIRDQNDQSLGQRTYQGSNFSRLGDWTGQCPDSVGGWEDGYFNIDVEADIDPRITEVRVVITNTLDQGAGDESIGYGDMQFTYEFSDDVEEEEPEWPATSPGNYDFDVENPTGLWENDCAATEKHCAGYNYYGGYNECAQGHSFWRTFEARKIHPSTDRVSFEGMIWTIDSWDGETFTIEMKDENGNVMDT
jgi:hypothetical protein